MSKINLLKNEGFEDSKPSNTFISWILSYGRVIIVCTELIVFVVFFSRFVYDIRLEKLQDSIEQKQNIVKSALPFENAFLETQKKLALIRFIEKDRYKLILALDMLESITPRLIRYTNIFLDKNIITLEGLASNNDSFAQFLAQLKRREEFDTVSLKSLQQLEDQTLKFKLALAFKPKEY